MTFINLGTNSASTKDWLEAIKNQSGLGVTPQHSSGLNTTLTMEQIRGQVASRPSTKTEVKGS
jgi:hypothetical protein